MRVLTQRVFGGAMIPVKDRARVLTRRVFGGHDPSQRQSARVDATCVCRRQDPDGAACHQADADPRPALPQADRGSAAGIAGRLQEGGFTHSQSVS